MFKVWLQWHRCEAPAKPRFPLLIQLEAEALLQLIWSSVTCWDMKPTLQSSFTLYAQKRKQVSIRHIEGDWRGSWHRHLGTIIQRVRSEAAVSLSHTRLKLYTIQKKGSAMTLPPLSLLISESQLEDGGINLLSTSCHFPMLILSALQWYEGSPTANFN